MCIGLPMKVLFIDGQLAHCEGMGEQRSVDLSLVPEVEVGDWLLVFMDAAREKLSDQAAAQIQQALEALNLAMNKPLETTPQNLDHLFPDLANREPMLPPHLRATTENS